MSTVGADVKAANDIARKTANAAWMAASRPGCRNLVTRYKTMNELVNQNIKCNHDEYVYGFKSVNDVYQYTCCPVPIGQKGVRGLPGFSGEKGDIGEKGPRGNPGGKGPQGDPGEKGPKGERGRNTGSEQIPQMNPLRSMLLDNTNDTEQIMLLLDIQNKIRKIVSSKKSEYSTTSNTSNDMPMYSSTADSPSIMQGQSYQFAQYSRK